MPVSNSATLPVETPCFCMHMCDYGKRVSKQARGSQEIALGAGGRLPLCLRQPLFFVTVCSKLLGDSLTPTLPQPHRHYKHVIPRPASHGFGNLNSEPHICAACALSLEPFLQLINLPIGYNLTITTSTSVGQISCLKLAAHISRAM